MYQTRKIHISEFDDFFLNIHNIAEVVKTEGVCVLRGIDVSPEQQFEAMIALGDIFGWFPNSNAKLKNYYFENHEFTITNRLKEFQIDMTNQKYKNEILVPWHIEQIGFINPAVGASWNMKIFTCDEECGKTYFVDSALIFCELNEDYTNFLEKCSFSVRCFDTDENKKNDNDNENIYQKMGVLPGGELCLKPIVNHEYQKYLKMIKISPSDSTKNILRLVSFDSREPTNSESEYFFKICNEISNRIFFDSGLRIVHKWKQHDFLIADLSRMYHSVTGGFRSEQRYFEGMWAYGKPGSKDRIEYI